MADDYSFLARLFFQHPLDPFDSMGGAFYWRPVGRQLYFSLVGAMLAREAWVVPVVHATILIVLALLLYRVARRPQGPAAAAAVAAFPLVSESARVLLGWGSGAQHLLASAGAVLAVHEAVFGRPVTAALAALGGVLSHESAAMMLPALPIAAWYGGGGRRGALRLAGAMALVAVVWGVGYWISQKHGVHFPPRGSEWHWAQAGTTWSRALTSLLNLEDLGHDTRTGFITAYALLLIGALVLMFTARRRALGAMTVCVLAAGAFLVGTLPHSVLSDWNTWRVWLPSLALGTALTGWLGSVSPWFAAGFVALRTAALLMQAPAPPIAESLPPITTSQMSFIHLTRLQRVVESTRHVLKAGHPRLPRGADVRYLYMPQLGEFGFQGSSALRVWYRDSTLSWRGFGGEQGYANRPTAMLEYMPDDPAPAFLDGLDIYDLMALGRTRVIEGRYREADSLLGRAESLHRLRTDRGPTLSSLIQTRARAAFNLGAYERADSMNRICMNLYVYDADPWGLKAILAMVRGDRQGARAAVARCLNINPAHVEALQLAQTLGMTQATPEMRK